MKKLVGENISELPFKGLKKIRNLVEFDGPILSHFNDDEGRNILFYWTDFDEQHNRWLVFEISESDLNEYLTKRISLKTAIQQANNGFYSVDIGLEVKYENIYKLDAKDIPEDYLPEQRSFYFGKQSIAQ